MKNSTKLRQSAPVAFGLIVLTIAMLDLWSKSAMIAWLTTARRTIEVTPFFNLRIGYNPGISFGLFPAESDLSRALLIGFALAATLLVVWLGLRSRVACSPEVRPRMSFESGYFQPLEWRRGHGTKGTNDRGDHRGLA